MRERDLFDRVTIVFVVLMSLLIIAIVGGYWWSNSIPTRPSGVPEGAIFLRAPATGVPGPPRGQWLACWESKGHNFCRLSAEDGTEAFEGEFIPYDRQPPIPATQLKISAKTSKEHAVWSGETWVPLVYLENGDVLIPAFQYEKGKLILHRQRERLQ